MVISNRGKILEQFNQEQEFVTLLKGQMISLRGALTRVSMRIFIVTVFSVYVCIPVVTHAHHSKEFRES